MKWIHERTTELETAGYGNEISIVDEQIAAHAQLQKTIVEFRPRIDACFGNKDTLPKVSVGSVCLSLRPCPTSKTHCRIPTKNRGLLWQ